MDPKLCVDWLGIMHNRYALNRFVQVKVIFYDINLIPLADNKILDLSKLKAFAKTFRMERHKTVITKFYYHIRLDGVM